MFKFFKQRIINWCLSIKKQTVGEIYDNSNAQQIAILDHNGNLKFVGEGKSNFLVKTPKGYSSIKRTFKTIEYDVWKLELENGMFLECADHHLVITKTGESHVSSLKIDDYILIDGGLSKVKAVSKLNRTESMYDLELDDEDHVYYTNGILSHNTTTVAVYMLWMTCFLEDKYCVIASKAMNHAVEIMSRIQFAYEELPNWIKPGSKYFSRTSVEFDNGSKIKSEATSAKTGRGGSPSLLMIDEIAFISRRIQDEMWASISPSLSTGGKLILTSTPNGDNDLFASLWRGAKSSVNSFFPIEAYWYQHPERDEAYYNNIKGKLGPVKVRQELDCEFLSSDALLINSIKLNTLKSNSPIWESMGFKFWKSEDEIGGKKKTYLVGVDPATGNNSDFTVIQVVEFPILEQVAELRLNTVNLPLIYSKIKWILTFLQRLVPGVGRSDVLWSFERNGIGEGLVALIQNDLDPTGGVFLDHVELFNDNPKKLGCYTTNKTKTVACLTLKNLVESINGFKINSDMLIFELKNFVAAGGSYAGKSGVTDDTVTAMLIVIRLLDRLSEYNDTAHAKLFSQVAPDSDEDDGSPMPFMIL